MLGWRPSSGTSTCCVPFTFGGIEFWEHCKSGPQPLDNWKSGPQPCYSIDQKPTWYNNVASRNGSYKFLSRNDTRPDVQQNLPCIRERYAIFTSVHSGGTEYPHGLPKKELIFKGGGRVLPVASSPSARNVVILDMMPGRQTDEVAEYIRSNGHLVLMHYPGMTSIVQVNDTNLHMNFKKEVMRSCREGSC